MIDTIQAELVDVRNVGTTKSLKLTFHVPQERALAVIEKVGWPTGADPIWCEIKPITDPDAA